MLPRQAIKETADRLHEQATTFYNAHYNNHVYMRATRDKTNAYANALLNETMALCGSPYYKLSHRKWSAEALRFLDLFTRSL